MIKLGPGHRYRFQYDRREVERRHFDLLAAVKIAVRVFR
ncbi:hypothetical protein JMUB5695_01470 [Mycobacterium heckeshornense]|uniref:Uncharacterized protein n=1 Tax=Mycobacterium heckeshornense TaxID=110505 RepID=A0A7R7TU58_9MYCO|nr:hypothetical protein MHEC_13120 [Mycobacterium heckeshornense]BCQ08045.1 hypothetical protein JMUB5695_01470 [Mycobacterium heckeshornense]